MLPAMLCGSAVMVRARVSRGSFGAMLKVGRRVGLVCEKFTALQACAPVVLPLPVAAQALVAAAACEPSPALPK
jgi:hypothetical protein